MSVDRPLSSRCEGCEPCALDAPATNGEWAFCSNPDCHHISCPKVEDMNRKIAKEASDRDPFRSVFA